MAYSFVQVPPNSTGVKIAGYTDATPEFHQTAVLVDQFGNPLIAATTTPGGSDMGLVVRLIGALPAGTNALGSVSASPATAATATLANISGATSSTTILAANANRLGATLFNDSSAAMYVKYGSTASLTSFTYKVGPSQQFELPVNPIYTGIITARWDSATGAARVTELTT